MSDFTTPPYLLLERTSVRRVMLQVLLALLPGVVAYVWLIGPILLLQLVVAMLAALAGEALMLGLRRKPLALFLSDGSALVTAWLVALAFPPLAPWWLVAVGARCSRSSSPNSSTVAWARILSIRRWSPLPCASSPSRP